MTTKNRRANRLAGETSPYLLQHAHNPVDWYPWGEEALNRAKAEQRPILLSIGYAACHWCHVMERESFENDAIAKLMNEHFINIKVDREERPDLDEIYMAATVAMNGSGGWPMTVFLTPEQTPFFAGTYFPPTDAYGRPGFSTLLERIAELWKNDRQTLVNQAKELTGLVSAQAKPSEPLSIGRDAIELFVQELARQFDPKYGGFSSAPKFPPSASLGLLLRYHRSSGDPEALSMVITTLDGMKNGGIYDQLGGGFARYSTDARWLVPHFEKMLYDNAQLAEVYLDAFQVTRHAEYRRVAGETLDYIIREMQSPEGGYFSATDADSEGEEGKYFVWTPDEVRAVLSAEDAESFCAFYDVTPEGNWEGKSVLNTPRSLSQVAGELGIDPGALTQSLERARVQMLEERQQRVPPLLDDKVLTAWNGLMLRAMAQGYRVLGRSEYLSSGLRAAQFVLEHMRRPDGGLYRTYRNGRAHLDAYLEDYAYLADGLLSLYEAGGSSELLQSTAELVQRMVDDFSDPEGGAFFATSRYHEKLIVRSREGHDGAMPNANAVAARVLARLSHHLDRRDYRALALQALCAYGQEVQRTPRAFATLLSVVDFLTEPPLEIVLAGVPGEASYEQLRAELGSQYLPNRVEAHVNPEAEVEQSSPLTLGKRTIGGAAALYLCQNYACQAPLQDAAAVAKALAAADRQAREASSSELVLQRLPGAASATATAAYAARQREGLREYRRLGTTGLCVSAIGFGGYRVDVKLASHRQALERALQSGVNLIDTSTNYTDGQSERLVGRVLSKLVEQKNLRREEVVVVSKVGYAQGTTLAVCQSRERAGRPLPEVVKLSDQLWHSIHPDFLQEQIGRSLARLGLEQLDFCLLHNPEYFLRAAAQSEEQDLEQSQSEFYRRLEAAFKHLEGEVERGRIGAYGVSSNTLAQSPDAPTRTELGRMLEAARAAGGAEHHFALIELPLNLLEADAALNKDDAGRSVLEVAQASNLGVLVNRPLNAYSNGALVRLIDHRLPESQVEFEPACRAVETLEQEYRTQFAPRLRVAENGPAPERFFQWGPELRTLSGQLQSLEQWQEVAGSVIRPRVAELCRAVERAFTGAERAAWHNWQERYLRALGSLFEAMEARAAAQSIRFAEALKQRLLPELPEALRNQDLGRLAIALVGSVPGVTSVLVGMRRTEYVAEAIAGAKLMQVDGALEALRAVRSSA